MNQRIEISHRTIIFTVFFLLFLWLLYFIRDILVLLFISFILMSALRPAVDKMESKKVPRALAIGILYVLIILSIYFIGRVIFPPLVDETIHLLNLIVPEGALPAFYKEVIKFVKNINLESFSQITPIGGNLLDVLSFTVSIFGGIVTALTLFVLTFYLLLERKHLGGVLEGFLPKDNAGKTVEVFEAVENRLGAWVRGQFLLSVVIGVLSFIGLSILGIKYALPLSIIAAILEIVPNIGPIISAIPPILVALTLNPSMLLAVIILYIIVQQVENIFVVPNVMRRVVGLSPVVTIIALMVGGKLMGIGGALLSVPIVLVIQTILQEYLKAE